MKRFLAVALVIIAVDASATPHHAHWHYMIGARVNGGRISMKQLFHEASMPGEFHLALARANAAEAQRFAEEIGEWASATVDVSTTEEVEGIRVQLQAMRREASKVAAGSAELGSWIDESLAARSGGDGENVDRARIAERARELFHGFGVLLRLHKDAEKVLGIPPPADPPPFDEVSTPSP